LRRNKETKIEEFHIYSSSRLGTLKTQYDTITNQLQNDQGKLILGSRNYELTNHLGNVLAVISDKKILNGTTFEADIVSVNDYYPFGMTIASRSFRSETYRFGFNGKENDKDFGEGIQDYGMRISDRRIGRFLSTDPLAPEYPWYTPYQFAGNKPIWAIDLDGLEELIYTENFPEDSPVFEVINSSEYLKENLITSISKPEIKNIKIYFMALPNEEFEEGTENASTLPLDELARFNIEIDKARKKAQADIADYKRKYGKTLAISDVLDLTKEKIKAYDENTKILKALGMTASQVVSETQKGNKLLAVIVDQDVLENAESGFMPEELIRITNSVAHEIDAHVKNKIANVELSQLEEHLTYYGIDETSRNTNAMSKKVYEAYVNHYKKKNRDFEKEGAYIKPKHYIKGTPARKNYDEIKRIVIESEKK